MNSIFTARIPPRSCEFVEQIENKCDKKGVGLVETYKRIYA